MKYRENFKLTYCGQPSYEVFNKNKGVRCNLTVKIITPDSLNANKIMDTTIITAKGYAKCDDKDVFNIETGKKIALARAESLAYHKAEVLIDKCVNDAYNFIDSAEKFANKSDYVQSHNKSYVKRKYGPCPTFKSINECDKKSSYKNQPRDSKGRFMPKENIFDCDHTSHGRIDDGFNDNCVKTETSFADSKVKGIQLKVNRNYSNKK